MVAGLLGAGNCLMKALITSGSDEFCQVSLGGKKLTGLYFKPTGKAGTEDGTQVPVPGRTAGLGRKNADGRRRRERIQSRSLW